MLTFSHIFLGLISSTFVSDLYGLIRRMLCLFFIGPYFIFTVPLLKHDVITNAPLNGVSYLYVSLLLSMNLSLTLAVVVTSFTIFLDYILINLRLFLLTY